MRQTTYYRINVDSPKCGKYSINVDTPNGKDVILRASKHKLFKDVEDKYYITRIQKAWIKNIINNPWTKLILILAVIALATAWAVGIVYLGISLLSHLTESNYPFIVIALICCPILLFGIIGVLFMVRWIDYLWDDIERYTY